VGEVAKALIILGMHRSGTSALAGQCASLGFWLGDDLLPANAANPKGFFEDLELIRADDRLVGLLFGGWASPLSWSESASEVALDHPRIAEIVAGIRAILERLGSKGQMWAVKEPRISRLLPLWWPLLRAMKVDARLIMALRHPDEVAASLARRDGLGPVTAKLMWLRHTAEPLVYAHEQGLPMAIMPYEILLSAPERLTETLARMGFAVQAAGEGFVDPELRHHRPAPASAAMPPDDDPLSVRCATLYEALMAHGAVSNWQDVPDEIVALAREACELSVEPYLKDLYREWLGVSNLTQRLFYDARKARQQAQQRARRHPLRRAPPPQK